MDVRIYWLNSYAVDTLSDGEYTARMKKVICLLGPTASGKSDLAIKWAKSYPIEIVSVDSALVYKGLDIGTAKPTLEERQAVPHHLIDLHDPSDVYSVGHFYQDAQKVITDIHRRNHIPLLVGGTMMYFHALYRGLADLPHANESIREDLLQQAKLKGWPYLYQKLTKIDPVAAKKIHENDGQRIQRALEVYYVSNKPLTQHLSETQSFLNQYEVFNLALMPEDRPALQVKIEQRLNKMLALGFKEEVMAFKARKNSSANLPAFRAVGYRQMWQYLDGEMDETELFDKIVIATSQLAKRQMTWLRMFGAADQHFESYSSAQECDDSLIMKSLIT